MLPLNFAFPETGGRTLLNIYRKGEQYAPEHTPVGNSTLLNIYRKGEQYAPERTPVGNSMLLNIHRKGNSFSISWLKQGVSQKAENIEGIDWLITKNCYICICTRVHNFVYIGP